MKYAALMYHELADGGQGGQFWVDMADFRAQLDYLAARDFSTMDLREAMDETERQVLVTLDDGHKSNFAAAEELARRGLKGTFYILKDKSLRDAEYLDERQIVDIAAMGHDIGIHGKDHKWWTRKSDRQLEDEFAETKNWLEQLVGRKVITCSAPGGKLNKRVVNVIRSQFPDIRYIRSSVEAFNDTRTNSGLLNCVAVRRGTTLNEFARIVNLGRLEYLKLFTRYYSKEFVKRILGR